MREEKLRTKQEINQDEKRMMERSDDYLAKDLWRMICKIEGREQRLGEIMEYPRSQQEQAFGTLDSRLDAMMERRAQTITDRRKI